MGVRFPGGPLRVGVALCVLAGLAWGKGAERPVTLSLVELGQQTAGGRPQVPGSTQATVHFVGDHHLLVTFPVRRLMKRLAECEPEDEDRTIDAVLVDVPSGKVAARTSWRVHDSGQYLWDLGHGRFMVRMRDRLLMVAPLEHLASDHPFEERQMLAFDQRIVGMLVSAESDLLTVETRPKRVPAVAGAKVPEGPVEIFFYRLDGEKKGIDVISAGRLLSRMPVEFPMTRDGYLDTSEEKKGRWVFDYIAHGGKKTELSPYDTSCYPVAKFVSRSEFVAFGCRGSVDRLEIGGFDMRGEEMWQQTLAEPFLFPTFSFAPEAGRFALGRALTTATANMMAAGIDPMGQQLSAQDVVVMQAHSGRQIFHTVLTPVQRSGQNFALAPDGSAVAVIRAATVEVHRLPALSAKDVADLREARAVPLERASGEIALPTRSHVLSKKAVAALNQAPDVGASQTAVAPPVVAAPPVAAPPVAAPPVAAPPVAAPPAAAPPVAAPPAAAPPAPKPAERTVQVGDSTQGEPRKAPSLYQPGEKGAPQ